jgi:hypothetical protein
MLKLLQEVKGFAHFANRSTETQRVGPLLLPFSGPRRRKATARRKYLIQVEMQDLPDIPHAVPIVYLPK